MLYGEEHLDYKLHAHYHLATQCIRFGQLNSIACFSFEGVFNKCKSFLNGTRVFVNQIMENIMIEQILDDKLEKIINEMADYRLKTQLDYEIE